MEETYAYYQIPFDQFDSSIITQIMKDSFLGSTYTLGIFNIAYGDNDSNQQAISTAALCGEIKTSPLPISPELLRLQMIYKKEIMQKKNEFSKEAMTYKSKKVIENDTKYIKLFADYNRIKQQLGETDLDRRTIAEKKNEAVSQKVDLTQKLIESEEERLNLSKFNIDLKMQNNKLKTEVEQLKNSLDLIGLNKDSTTSKKQKKEEEKGRRIQELEDAKSRMEADYRSLELEYAVLRKNYNDKVGELESFKKKNELVNAEFLSLANQMNMLNSDSSKMKQSTLVMEYEKAKANISKLSDENIRLREELNDIKTQISSLINEKEKAENQLSVSRNDHERKLLELEKSYNEQLQKKANEYTLKMDQFFSDKKNMSSFNESWESEKTHLTEKLKKAEQQIELLCREQETDRKSIDDLTREKTKLAHDLQETIAQHVKKLESYAQPMQLKTIREEIEKEYLENEARIKDQINAEQDKGKKLRNRLLALRTFTIQVKDVLRNIAPDNKQLAELMEREPMELVEENAKAREEELCNNIDQLKKELLQNKDKIELLKLQNDSGSPEKIVQEYSALKEEKIKLLEDIHALQIENKKLSNGEAGKYKSNFESSIQKEVQLLKEDKSAMQRPGSSVLKAENVKLLEEIKALKHAVT